MGEIVGREQERELLRGVLATARRGRSAVLVLHGEPGAGKTALLDDVQGVADGFDVLRFDAVQSEATFGFGALHQLLRPYLGSLSSLPAPQGDALAAAFGLRAYAQAPDLFLIGLAALGLVSARAGDRPLLCVVDDAQWLDQESAAVLAFVARRLDADPVAMVFALRESDAFDGLPRAPIAGLGRAAAAELLERVAGKGVDARVRDAVAAATGGNPLALIELARELSPAQLSGGAPLPDPIPPGPAWEERYRDAIRTLPAATRILLLTGAADPSGDPEVLWRAGKELGFGVEDAAPAEERKLVEIRAALRFRHPMIRSAAYYQAPLAERQRVHAALALVSAVLGEPDREAWHLAAATSDPDEVVAATLQRAADRERGRGGWAAAAELLARAGALSPRPSDRTVRLLVAAEAACVAGSASRAQTLLDSLHPVGGPELRVQARIHRLRREPVAATTTLLAAAVARDSRAGRGGLELRVARDALLEAVVQAKISDRLAPAGATEADVARVARSLPLPRGMAPTVGDLLLDADTALHLDGLTIAAPLLRRAIVATLQAPPDAPELFAWLAAACAHATVLADDVALHEAAFRLRDEATRRAAVIPMALAMNHTGAAELWAGRVREAEHCFDQRAALDGMLGLEQGVGAMLVAAWRGQGGLSVRVRAEAVRQGQGYQLVFADYADFVVRLGKGHYADAYAILGSHDFSTSQLKFALADLVEAAVRSGASPTAHVSLLSELAEACPVPRTLGDLARARALLADDEEQYRSAIELHERTRGPASRARSHQVYGEWLRRARRTKEARTHLRTAYELFEEMGAGAFAARAATELAAAGVRIKAARTSDQAAGLTPQEARIARLAAGGATNTEIAAQLYLSTNTVEYHLRKVFRKLGVSSRRKLYAELEGLRTFRDGEPHPAP
ncbi:helix-turn-helix transcriptional regulator [Winogradskya humida]|uniref:LuxR family transcriptional regulator n=1 Tax=Winogradskya humida TaxID=113566 RepID=A0ABQ3ZED6_9ACTN|nr:LuxR family transcriptional regulator [Actinoplanes humidus]GIE16941.1 LuxR family transcriptional regulator [Actinoplanes humidus]